MNTHKYTGNAKILAHCIKSQLADGRNDRSAEEAAFRTACCRQIDRNSAEDLAHLADAWQIVRAA